MPVKGIERVRRGFRVRVQEIASVDSRRAVHVLLSQGAALAQTMTPIDTSNLVNSQYVPRVAVDGKSVKGYVGYTAAYAVRVHSASGSSRGRPRDPKDPSRGHFWDPNAEPRFLSKGFEELKPSIPTILKAHYRV